MESSRQISSARVEEAPRKNRSRARLERRSATQALRGSPRALATAAPDASLHRSAITKHLWGLRKGTGAPPLNPDGSRAPSHSRVSVPYSLTTDLELFAAARSQRRRPSDARDARRGGSWPFSGARATRAPSGRSASAACSRTWTRWPGASRSCTWTTRTRRQTSIPVCREATPTLLAILRGLGRRPDLNSLRCSRRVTSPQP